LKGKDNVLPESPESKHNAALAQHYVLIRWGLLTRPKVGAFDRPTGSITKLTKDLYAAGRAIVTRLRPEILDTLGLSKAIEELVNHFNRGNNTCVFTFKSVGDFAELESGLTMAVYRLVQEGLSNVAKHSKATKAGVFLALSASENMLTLKITDNGIGFDPYNVNAGLGLVGMRERVYGFNGEIAMHPGVDGGTEIEAIFPTAAP